MNSSVKNIALLTCAALAACSGDDSDSNIKIVKAICDQTGSVFSAAISTVAADYTGADVEIITAGNGECTILAGQLPETESDYTVSAYKDSFYHIGRFGLDSISKYKFSDPSSDVFFPETAGGKGYGLPNFSNAYGMEFISETKAYIPFYGLDKAWEVNPSAETEASFRTADVLNVSAYNGADTKPEVVAIKSTGTELFIFMQRLNTTSYPYAKEGSYVAVFEHSNLEEEVDTGKGVAPLKGIQLPAQNPISVDYHEDVGFLLAAVSEYNKSGEGVAHDAGIIKLDPSTYETTLLVGDEESDGAAITIAAAFSNVAIVDKDNAFFVAYIGWQNNDLYHLDLQTNTATKVSELSGLNISVVKGDPLGNVWVGINDAVEPRIEVLSKTGKSIGEFSLTQGPNAIAFAVE